MHRILTALPAALEGAVGPDTVVRLVETIIGHARAHPVLVKVLNDELHLLGPVLVSDLGTVAARVADVVAPLLEALMAAGQLSRRDHRVVAEWLVRQPVRLRTRKSSRSGKMRLSREELGGRRDAKQ